MSRNAIACIAAVLSLVASAIPLLPMVKVQAAPGGKSARPVLFVNRGNSGAVEDGQSWSTGFRTIQAAITAADVYTDTEIWITADTYDERRTSVLQYPLVDTGSVTLKPLVHLYGGFAGTELSRLDRAAGVYTTVDGSTSRGGRPAYHVIVGAASTTLDRLRVVGGRASQGDLDRDAMGAGLYHPSGSCLISNCVFTDCVAQYGAGVDMYSGLCRFEGCVFEALVSTQYTTAAAMSGESTFIDCRFSYNYATHPIYGTGAKTLQSSSKLTMTGCTFEENWSGGVEHTGGEIALKNCVFRGNEGRDTYADRTTCTLENCLFAGEKGGLFFGGTTAVVRNCTLARTSPFSTSPIECQDSTLTMTNSIVWASTSESIGLRETTHVNVSYSDVEGGYAGVGNIDVDPLFKDPANGRFTLVRESPCVDAGQALDAPLTDLLGTPRPSLTGFDMGAYEFITDDQDGDGMDDAWEFDHGLDPSNPNDGTLDPDGDGVTNVNEYLANADPQDDTDPRSEAYVAKSGSDVTGDGSASAPWLTIQHAIGALAYKAHYRPVTLHVGAGTFDEAVRLVPSITIAGSGTEATKIQHYSASEPEHIVVTGAANTGLRDCQVRVSGFPANMIVLLRMNDVAMELTNVVFDGNDCLYSLGALISQSGTTASVIQDCTFRRLYFGIQAVDSGITIRRSLFEGLRGDAIFVRLPDTKTDTVRTPLLGDASMAASTGQNRFRSVSGKFLINMTSGTTLAENNDWGIYTSAAIAAKLDGQVDYVPFVGETGGEGEGEGEHHGGCHAGPIARGVEGDAVMLVAALVALWAVGVRKGRSSR